MSIDRKNFGISMILMIPQYHSITMKNMKRKKKVWFRMTNVSWQSESAEKMHVINERILRYVELKRGTSGIIFKFCIWNRGQVHNNQKLTIQEGFLFAYFACFHEKLQIDLQNCNYLLYAPDRTGLGIWVSCPDRTGHPKLQDKTESGLMFFNIIPTKYGLSILRR